MFYVWYSHYWSASWNYYFTGTVVPNITAPSATTNYDYDCMTETTTTDRTASSTISRTTKNCRQHIITVIVGTYCMLLTTVAIIAKCYNCCHQGNGVQVWFISYFFLLPLETNNHSHPLHAAIGHVCGGVNTGRL